jgi:hypothetical protein
LHGHVVHIPSIYPIAPVLKHVGIFSQEYFVEVKIA